MAFLPSLDDGSEPAVPGAVGRYVSVIQTTFCGGGGAGRGAACAGWPGWRGSGGTGGGAGGLRLYRAKFGIATSGRPSANRPVITMTPPSRSDRHAVLSGADGSSVFVMSWSTASML